LRGANGWRGCAPDGCAATAPVVFRDLTEGILVGAASSVGAVLDSIADQRKAFVVDFAAVPFLDSTAANAMARVATKAARQGIRLYITGASPTVHRALLTHGVVRPRATYRETIARAVADIKGAREVSPNAAEEALAAS
jgi:sulfate permease, SulP family